MVGLRDDVHKRLRVPRVSGAGWEAQIPLVLPDGGHWGGKDRQRRRGRQRAHSSFAQWRSVGGDQSGHPYVITGSTFERTSWRMTFGEGPNDNAGYLVGCFVRTRDDAITVGVPSQLGNKGCAQVGEGECTWECCRAQHDAGGLGRLFAREQHVH